MNNSFLKPLEHLYECECPHLNRGLPFRNEFAGAVLNHILTTYNAEKHPHLVYVSQGPGGLLWDAQLISKLIQHNYTKLDLVFIEPLYEEHADILYACLTIKKWCKELSTDSHVVTPHFYKNFTQYKKECAINNNLKGMIFITVDPDDATTMPHFSSLTFRKKFSRLCKQVMQPESTFYYLYFQTWNDQPYRHMIIGKHSTFEKKSLIHCKHSYGITALNETTHTYVFLDAHPVYPFNQQQQMVQIHNSVIVHPTLSSLVFN